MKKYVKPALFMERFEMAEHIARCGANHAVWDDDVVGFNKPNMYAEQCSIDLDMFGGTINYFISSACENQWNEENAFGICYQGEAGSDKQIFYS